MASTFRMYNNQIAKKQKDNDQKLLQIMQSQQTIFRNQQAQAQQLQLPPPQMPLSPAQVPYAPQGQPQIPGAQGQQQHQLPAPSGAFGQGATGNPYGYNYNYWQQQSPQQQQAQPLAGNGTFQQQQAGYNPNQIAGPSPSCSTGTCPFKRRDADYVQPSAQSPAQTGQGAWPPQQGQGSQWQQTQTGQGPSQWQRPTPPYAPLTAANASNGANGSYDSNGSNGNGSNGSNANGSAGGDTTCRISVGPSSAGQLSPLEASYAAMQQQQQGQGGRSKMLPADSGLSQVQMPSSRSGKYKPALVRGQYVQANKQYPSSASPQS
jgi:hypothetical protein